MTNPDYTHLALIVDRSGSMSSIAQDMNGGIATLISEQAKLPGELHIDIFTFDDHFEHPYSDSRPDDVKGEIIVPRGSTALNDAIGKGVTLLGERFAALPEDERPGKVIVAVVTDGLENASREWRAAQVHDLLKKQQDEFAWEFLFLGANIDVTNVGATLGFQLHNTMAYDASAGGAVAMASAVGGYTTRSRLDGDTSGFTEAERAEAN